MLTNSTFLHFFQTDIASVEKPLLFNFPFCYEPHQLAKTAAKELQQYLGQQTDFVHNFGLSEGETAPIGKMFGVLVVECPDGRLAYLAACSGKLAGRNEHAYFVPPVFDMLTKDSFFLREEEQINAMNRRIEVLEADEDCAAAKAEFILRSAEGEAALKHSREEMKRTKNERKEKRTAAQATLAAEEYEAVVVDLIKQSYRDQHEHAVLKTHWKEVLEALEQKIQAVEGEIAALKQQRKSQSAALQAKLFDQYQFLNAKGEKESVLKIFGAVGIAVPPAGAGECAAPKLLHYAYQHGLTPICMAEFWWGASPGSEVRKHKSYYPACKSKCEPILGHMLIGLDVEANPLLENPAEGKSLSIIYQDDDIIVVNKPAEFLSVPGINVQDSVFTRIQAQFPEVEGPVIIHRLDMSTSGILVLAKHKDAHQFIQDQFIKHTVVKRYAALLDGTVKEAAGRIDLPLRVDLDDRPRQLICYTHGKPAQTRYEVVESVGGRTKVHFFPETGRTHQLRVHAAHHLGLDCPIVGDDLYGQRANRLHLHAAFIEFVHPSSREKISFTVLEPF